MVARASQPSDTKDPPHDFSEGYINGLEFNTSRNYINHTQLSLTGLEDVHTYHEEQDFAPEFPTSDDAHCMGIGHGGVAHSMLIFMGRAASAGYSGPELQVQASFQSSPYSDAHIINTGSVDLYQTQHDNWHFQGAAHPNIGTPTQPLVPFVGAGLSAAYSNAVVVGDAEILELQYYDGRSPSTSQDTDRSWPLSDLSTTCSTPEDNNNFGMVNGFEFPTSPGQPFSHQSEWIQGSVTDSTRTITGDFQPPAIPERIRCNCGRDFAEARSLQRHLNTGACGLNSGPPPVYICCCGKEIPRRDNHKRHLRTCKKPVVCSEYKCKCTVGNPELVTHLKHIDSCGSRSVGRPRTR